ncbi:MAG: transcriptional regulator, partial [Mesorhizobium sp.]
LMKVIQALDEVGVELIGENQASERGGRGVRLKAAAAQNPQG